MKKLLKNEPLKIILGLCLFIPGLILEWVGQDTAAFVLFTLTVAVAGFTVFVDAVKGIIRLDFLDEKFLMSIASVGALIIREAEEGAAVMLFFLVGEWFEHIAVRKSRNSIKSLMDICPDTATVLCDGVEQVVDAEDVEVGSTVIIRSGERVAIDSVVISGTCDIDSSALTGESLPISVGVGDEVHSGVVVIGGAITCRTLRPAEESAASRVLELVESASEHKSREEAFITKFSRFYTPVVIILALFMAIVPPLFSWLNWTDAVHRALSFLVISCPCALVISVPLSFFGGIGAAASRGILYKGADRFSAISSVKSVVFDKTGTLTEGVLEIIEVAPVGIGGDELVALAASSEYGSNHPIALCLKKHAPRVYEAENVSEIVGKGVRAEVLGRNVAVGNSLLMRELGIDIPNSEGSAVYVAVDGEYRGSIGFGDKLKAEAPTAIAELRKLGVTDTYILSGDKSRAVLEVGNTLGIDHVHAELLPQDKYELLDGIQKQNKGSVVYVGDGINDAPCLMRADVGIAMGGVGSDSAIEAADAVIMADNLSKLPEAVGIARKTLRIAKENIAFAIGVKLLIILLSAARPDMWLAVFADVGVAVLAILNSMRMLLHGRKKQK